MSYEDVLKRAKGGDPDAQVAMGYLFFRGDGVTQDRREAARWFGLAADQGNAEALCNLGYMRAHGAGLRLDLEKAMELYERSAELGYARAMFNLGFMYSDVEGVEQDWGKAFEWYSRSAEAGSVMGTYRMGVMLQEGRGILPGCGVPQGGLQAGADIPGRRRGTEEPRQGREVHDQGRGHGLRGRHVRTREDVPLR